MGDVIYIPQIDRDLYCVRCGDWFARGQWHANLKPICSECFEEKEDSWDTMQRKYDSISEFPVIMTSVTGSIIWPTNNSSTNSKNWSKHQNLSVLESKSAPDGDEDGAA